LPGDVPGRIPNVHVYRGPSGIGLLFSTVACTNTRTVLVVGFIATMLAVSVLPVSAGLSTQSAGFKLRAVLGKVTSFPVPATGNPVLIKPVTTSTVPPASPMSVPMSMWTSTGVAVTVGVSVDVGVGVEVAVSVGVLVTVGVGV